MLTNKNLLSLSALLSLCVVFILTGCEDNVAPQQGPAEVGIYVAATHPITITTFLPGRASAYAVAEVRPQVNGIILKRSFTEGGEVKAGQPLYQIDSAAYQATYESAKAALAKAEASAMVSKTRSARYKSLVADQAVSKQEYEDAMARLKEGTADVLAAKAELQTAQLKLSYTQVNSPISGCIGRSAVTQGALVSAAQPTPLAIVQQLDPIYVDVNQSSVEYLRLRRELESGHLQQADADSASVKLVLEDGSEYPFAGRLQLTDINIDPSTSAVTLRAIFPNPKGLILPGIFVRAKLVEGINNQAILLPQQSLMRDQKGEPYVFIVDKDNKVAVREISVGQAIGNRWVVLKGIKAGDQVIVEGLQKVKPGIVVKTARVQTFDTRDPKVNDKVNLPQPVVSSTGRGIHASATLQKNTLDNPEGAISGIHTAASHPQTKK